MILASRSPRRIELLKKLVSSFKIIIPEVEEIKVGNAELICLENAKLKAFAVAKNFPDEVVIGADTVVALNGEILGKPIDKAQNELFLKKLSGSVHEVLTGYAVIFGKKEFFGIEKTQVIFNDLSETEILDYVSSEDGLDKAGGYAIQNGKFVKKIVGSYDNVVGFPTERIENILKDLKVIV
ncbi:MAG TPA: septum formation protein Maf [Clostridiales bacterium]|nr:septum formation protein Maf [Clostridiales bacterium]